MSNDTILIEIATDTNLTCEQIQEVYGHATSIDRSKRRECAKIHSSSHLYHQPLFWTFH